MMSGIAMRAGLLFGGGPLLFFYGIVKSMEKESKLLFPLFIIIILFVTALTYYRTMVVYDYPVIESEPLEELEETE